VIAAAQKTGVKLQTAWAGSLMTAFFTAEPVIDYDSATRADTGMFGKFHRLLLDQGIYWPPSQFEAAFVSLTHNEDDISKTIRVVESALMDVAAGG